MSSHCLDCDYHYSEKAPCKCGKLESGELTRDIREFLLQNFYIAETVDGDDVFLAGCGDPEVDPYIANDVPTSIIDMINGKDVKRKPDN